MYDRKYYHKYREVSRGGRGGRVDFTLAHAKIPKHHQPLLVLDLGCGIGTYSQEARRRGHEVIGLDVSKDALVLAQEHNKINLILATATCLPFKPNVFDRILFIDVFEHLKEPLKSLSEINRVLRPKGLLMLQTPNKGSIITLILKDVTHRRIYSVNEVKELLRLADFRKIRVMVTSFLPRLYPLSVISRRFFRALIVVTSLKE